MTLKIKEEQTDNTAAEAEAVENTETTETTTPEPKTDESAALKERLAALEAKNQELESKLTTTTANQPKTPTSIELRGWSDEQKEKASEIYGMPFDKILSTIEARERAELENSLTETRASSNVREAIEAACESDPQVTKLKAHIREFLADIPTSDKADARKLNNWMKKAVSYARGQAGTKATTTPKAKNEPKTPGPDAEPIMDTDDNDTGRIQMEDGSTIRIEKLISDEKRKEMKHPSRDNAIRISCDFDKPPKMR